MTPSAVKQTCGLPIDYRLYLPKDWAGDPARRAKAGVPDEISFQTKPSMALDQIRKAVADDIPPGVVLADAGYGADMKFQTGLLELGLDYVVGIQASRTRQVHLAVAGRWGGLHIGGPAWLSA